MSGVSRLHNLSVLNLANNGIACIEGKPFICFVQLYIYVKCYIVLFSVVVVLIIYIVKLVYSCSILNYANIQDLNFYKGVVL